MKRRHHGNGRIDFDVNGSLQKIDYLADIRLQPSVALVVGGGIKSERMGNFLRDAQRDQTGVFAEVQLHAAARCQTIS